MFFVEVPKLIVWSLATVFKLVAAVFVALKVFSLQ